MRVACLVLAYAGGTVLARSLPIFRAAGWDVFVHLDRKADRPAYLQALGAAAGQCVFVDAPLEVFWGGYSMMLAAFKLIDAARAAGPYGKYLFISDDAFPVLPPEQLAAHLSSEADQICLFRQAASSPQADRYRQFFYYDHPTTAGRGYRRHPAVIDAAIEEKIGEIAALRRAGKKPIEVYCGTAYWALTDPSLGLVLRHAREDRHLARSFEFAAQPDESMIHSILGNYKYREDRCGAPVYATLGSIATAEDLPYDLQPQHVLVRKFAPHAVGLLDAMAARLDAGLPIYPRRPGAPQLGGSAADIVGFEPRVAALRLAAPADDPAPGWHPVEHDNFCGRLYRWTAAERIEWNVPAPAAPAGTIRFVLTPVLDVPPEYLSGCSLSVAGQTKPLQRRNGKLVVEFEDAATGCVQAVLTTPGLRQGPSPDDRRLGLPVAC